LLKKEGALPYETWSATYPTEPSPLKAYLTTKEESCRSREEVTWWYAAQKNRNAGGLPGLLRGEKGPAAI